MPKYEHLKKNLVYLEYVKYGNKTEFYEFMTATLMVYESHTKGEVNNALQFVKSIKDETQLGLKRCKDWYDILRDLGFIYNDFNTPPFKIYQGVKEINSMEDIIYMIENDLSMEFFLRKTKLNNIMKRMKDGNS